MEVHNDLSVVVERLCDPSNPNFDQVGFRAEVFRLDKSRGAKELDYLLRECLYAPSRRYSTGLVDGNRAHSRGLTSFRHRFVLINRSLDCTYGMPLFPYDLVQAFNRLWREVPFPGFEVDPRGDVFD